MTPSASRAVAPRLRIETFESEVEPMVFALLDSGHFVLFRRVWHRDERYVQGHPVRAEPLLSRRWSNRRFASPTLSSMSRLGIVAYQGA